ncbi:MAG: hypothetical protein GY701_10670 [Sulfitobacter sp.]|uniref:hypothetical protein n=1 Tax=Sulfitobacter TaxID=60136 RepID=UPI0000669F64|nr:MULTISPECIES: hypothetical protein [unclassified Sulfitobacter]AXI51319.1 hypothetical protein C1J04_10490 [Sulfitobacter sp. SK025]EAP80856.1 hypothetical protein NAS141_05943 [Sulfitobacter sp. NAS-14.1]MCP3878838.1 hypothetical protein [Sulfitobacter sp.]
MTRFTAFAAALLMTAGAASAQVTTQAAVGGESGVPGYPTTVVGADGVTYACQAPTEIDGIIARRCIDPNAAGGVGFEGLSPAAAGGIAAVIVAVAVIASNDDDANGTNGSNGSNGS